MFLKERCFISKIVVDVELFNNFHGYNDKHLALHCVAINESNEVEPESVDSLTFISITNRSKLCNIFEVFFLYIINNVSFQIDYNFNNLKLSKKI